MNMANPTNRDIMITLTEIRKDLGYVITLAEKTNGRVTKLESWRTKLQAVADYKDKHPEPAVVNNYKPIYMTEGGQKILMALAGILTVVGSILALRGGL